MTHPPMLPSAMRNDVGTPVAIISQLNTLPACAPVNASLAASRLAMHDSGSGWSAKPFLCDSSIHYSTPVYPGALSILLEDAMHRKVRNIGAPDLVGPFDGDAAQQVRVDLACLEQQPTLKAEP